MSLALTEEQQELQSTVRRFFNDTAPLEFVRKCFEEGEQADRAKLEQVKELALEDYFSVPLSEGGGSIRDLSLIAFECGRALYPDALYESLYAGAHLFGRLLGEDVPAKVTLVSPGSLFDLEIKNSSVLCGKLRLLPNASPDSVLVIPQPDSVLISNGAISELGELSDETSLDRTVPYKSLELDSVEFERKEIGPEFFAGLQLLKMNELAGITDRVIQMTVEYVSERKQFGVPVGGFQAVQQQLSDAYLLSESFGALSRFAAWAFENSTEQSEIATAAAVRYGTKHAVEVVEKSIQLHGGIGFTWEYDLHFFLRRARLITALFSNNKKTLNSLLSVVTPI